MAEAAAQFQKGLDQLALLAGHPRTSATGARILQCLGRGVDCRQRLRRAGNGPCLCPRTRAVGAAGFSLGVPSDSLLGQSLYHVIRGELDLAQRLDEDLLRLSRQRNDSAGLVLGHLSSGRTLMFAGRFASSRSHLEEALALYDPISHRSLVRQAGIHPSRTLTGGFGDCPFLSRLSRPGIGTEQRGNRRGAEAGSSAVFGSELGTRHPVAFARRRQCSPRRAGRPAGCGDDRAGFPLLAVRWERSIAGGSRSRMAMWRRGYRSCAAVRPLTAPPGRSMDAISYRPPGRGM